MILLEMLATNLSIVNLTVSIVSEANKNSQNDLSSYDLSPVRTITYNSILIAVFCYDAWHVTLGKRVSYLVSVSGCIANILVTNAHSSV